MTVEKIGINGTRLALRRIEEEIRRVSQPYHNKGHLQHLIQRRNALREKVNSGDVEQDVVWEFEPIFFRFRSSLP